MPRTERPQAPEVKLRDGGADNVKADNCGYNWMHHNTFRTYGNECIDVKEGSTHNLIEYNVCEMQRDPNSGGFDLRGDLNTVRFNEITECDGAGVRMGGHDGYGSGNHAYGNVITNMGNGAFNVMAPDQGTVCENKISGASAVRTMGASVRFLRCILLYGRNVSVMFLLCERLGAEKVPTLADCFTDTLYLTRSFFALPRCPLLPQIRLRVNTRVTPSSIRPSPAARAPITRETWAAIVATLARPRPRDQTAPSSPPPNPRMKQVMMMRPAPKSPLNRTPRKVVVAVTVTTIQPTAVNQPIAVNHPMTMMTLVPASTVTWNLATRRWRSRTMRLRERPD